MTGEDAVEPHAVEMDGSEKFDATGAGVYDGPFGLDDLHVGEGAAALWSPQTAGAVLGGAAVAIVALAAIAWAMLRYSSRLPISKFFAVSAAMAFVLAGKGLAAHQEAGIVSATRIAGLPKLDLLGFYPTWQTVLLQLAVIAILIAGYVYNRSTRQSEEA
ncbi:hypothetical protein MCEMIH16_03077 [Caulobacteraceae bacterium]